MNDIPSKPPIKENQSLLTDEEFANEMEAEFRQSRSSLDQEAKARIWSKVSENVSARSQSFWRKPQIIPMVGLAAIFCLLMFLKPVPPSSDPQETRLKGAIPDVPVSRKWIDRDLVILALQKTEDGFQAVDFERDESVYIVKPDQMVGFKVSSNKGIYVGLYLSTQDGKEFSQLFLSGPLQGKDAEVGIDDRPFSYSPNADDNEFEICSLISHTNSKFPQGFARSDNLMQSANCYLFRR